MKKGGLGRGLDLIFAENNGEEGERAVSVSIDEIEPNRDQPRQDFDPESLGELADSISRHGVLQPLLLRPLVSGGYRIVAGERRYRAARMAGLKEIPALVRDMTDAEETVYALIENLQREDLNPIEEARGYRRLIDTYDFTQEQVSEAVGKSRPAVANSLRLLNLPIELQGMLEAGQITPGHARALLSFSNPEDAKYAIKRAQDGATVRELETLAKRAGRQPKSSPDTPQKRFYREAQIALTNYLGRRVKITGSGKKCNLQIEFYGEKDLRALLNELKLSG